MTTKLIETGITYIPVKNLSVVWVQCQRPYNEKWAKTIAENFDPDMFDPLIVTKPNGNGIYHIIEGQHRRHALEFFAAKINKNGIGENEQAPCRIVTDADPARAAKIWRGINGGRKAPRPIHDFIVGVTAGDEPEVTINDIVNATGFKVAQEKKANCIGAVGALKIVHDRVGKTVLKDVLKTIRIMWRGDPAAASNSMIRGIGIFVGEFGPHLDAKRLIKISEKWSPYDLVQAAEARKQSSLEKLDEAISELLMKEYNRGLRGEGTKLKHKS